MVRWIVTGSDDNPTVDDNDVGVRHANLKAVERFAGQSGEVEDMEGPTGGIRGGVEGYPIGGHQFEIGIGRIC